MRVEEIGDALLFCADCTDIVPLLPSPSLIVAGPPYFRIKGGFDFVWPSMADYLADVEKWARVCCDTLPENGTLYWFGDEKNIAYTQVIIDKMMSLANSLVWYKTDLKGGMYGSAGGDTVRSFPVCTERVLMYSNERGDDRANFTPLRDYFRALHTRIGVPLKEICSVMGHRKAEHCFYYGSTQWGLPTEGIYREMARLFGLESWGPFRGYEELRREYEELRRPFNNSHNLTEVLEFKTNRQDQGLHPTMKPVPLIRALISTSSRPGDTVLDPFMGSGTTGVAAIEGGRKFVGIESDPKHFDNACRRIAEAVKC